MKNIPIITYIQRYWLLIIAAAVFIGLCLNETVFQHLGALIYVPAVVLIGQLSYLLVVHLFFRQTIDQDENDGTFLAEWRGLTPSERVRLTVALRIGLSIAVAIIAASVGK